MSFLLCEATRNDGVAGHRLYAQALCRPAKKGAGKAKTELLHFPLGDGVTDAFSSVRRHQSIDRASVTDAAQPRELVSVSLGHRPEACQSISVPLGPSVRDIRTQPTPKHTKKTQKTRKP